MEIVLYGAGKFGRKAYEIICEYYKEDYSVISFADSLQKGSYCGKQIVDMDHIDKRHIVVITVADMYMATNIYLELLKKGFKKIYWFLGLVVNREKNNDFLKDECWSMEGWGDCILPHMELHISDKCNLNCKGCTHFSPLFNEIGAGFDEVMRDVVQVSRIFSNVARLDILGGEPLLCNDLENYVAAIRRVFPAASIDIFTNGLLIPSLSEKAAACIRDNNVFLSITEYRPTHYLIDKIISRLNSADIKYTLVPYDTRMKFNKPISTSSHSKYSQMCISNGCVTVAHGKIARCPTLMYIDKFNEYFGEELPNDGIISLDGCESGFQLLAQLKEEVPLCKHCIQCDMEWGSCGKNISFDDFAVRE